MMYTLSKSDFKVASTCAKKLQYKKQGYPNSMEENDFLNMLAEGGYIVGKLATIIYPGIEIKGNTYEAVHQTRELLKQDHVTLHEAAVQSGQKLVRIDILRKTGDVFELIEVKSKSFNSEDEKNLDKIEDEYKEDVAYQTMVLQECYPEADIRPFLLLPDKAKYTEIEGLASWFKVIESEYVSGLFRGTVVEFIETPGTKNYEIKRKMLQDDALLKLVDLSKEVDELMPVIENRSEQFLRILNDDFVFAEGDYVIDKTCKDCEYRAEQGEERNGYDECWGDMSATDPHIFDLFYGGAIGSARKGYYLDELIGQKKVALNSIDRERLRNANGDYGRRAIRQLIQLEYTEKNSEWVSNELDGILASWQYPLHFIDFETYTGAIPYHKGMRPYEVIAFQWSCHTIHSAGAEPVHTEWINEVDSFPNFRFAESLMMQIGDSGTPLMWATHENTVLRNILRQMDHREYNNPKLKAWLMDIVRDNDLGLEGRLVDMNALTLAHYFHPYMKGRTSIKKTLPAVWNHNPFLYNFPWFKSYYLKEADGSTANPYKALKSIFATKTIEDALAEREIEEVVTEGGAAMKAYHNMMYGDPANRDSLKQQLLEYCKLDTLAMVMIYTYWRKREKLNKRPKIITR